MQDDNTNNTTATQTKQPLQDYYLNKSDDDNQPNTDPAQKKKVIAVIMAITVAVVIIIIIAVAVGGENSMNGIEIIEEQLVINPLYTVIGDNLYPIVVVKVKNTSNTIKKLEYLYFIFTRKARNF